MPIKITAKKDGFRRCGVEHTGTVEHPDDAFTKEQIELLKKEPNLVVEIIPGTAAKQNALNVADTVALVQAAATVEALDALAEGEARKGVTDAIAKRRAELNPA